MIGKRILAKKRLKLCGKAIKDFIKYNKTTDIERRRYVWGYKKGFNDCFDLLRGMEKRALALEMIMGEKTK